MTTPEWIDALAPKLAPKAEGDAIVRKHSWGQRKPPRLVDTIFVSTKTILRTYPHSGETAVD